MKNRFVLLLGSNMGVRPENLSTASDLLNNEFGTINKKSSVYETEAWGITAQSSFLNQVLIFESELPAEKLLSHILAIELKLGRLRKQKWGARSIDIDILYCNEDIIHTTNLVIPHPEMHKRRFTLVPLCEIDPDFIHPVLKKRNIQLLRLCEDLLQVKEFSDKT